MRLQIQREFCHPTYFPVSYNDCRFYAFDGRFIVDELNTLLKEYFKILNMVGDDVLFSVVVKNHVFAFKFGSS